MHQVSVTRKAHGASVPSIGGVGGFVLQEDVTLITTHTGAIITVIGTRSRMGEYDVTADAPASDHAGIVAYWQAQAEGWAASAAHLSTPDEIEVEGVVVMAPGFTVETFAAGLAKARKAGYMSMRPLQGGAVRIDTGKAGSVYTVTRHGCTCKGHMGHGHCYHRAAVIFCDDVSGIDLGHEEVLGFGTDGSPVIATPLQEVA